MKFAIAAMLLILSLPMGAPALAAERTPLATGAHEQIVNGVRLWYRVAGRSDGTPVVFLHGGPGQGSQTFAKFAGPHLEPSLRMVYLDQRGSGRSERPWTNAYSMDLLVEDLEQLRRAWKVPKIALIGHSFGTIPGLEYAARYPAHVSHLVLVAGVPDAPAAVDLQCARLERLYPDTYRKAVERLAPGSEQRCHIFAAPRSFIDGAMFPDPEIMRLVDEADSEGGLRNTGDVGRAMIDWIMRYRFDRPERLTMPVLIVAGGEDHQAVIEPQRALTARLHDARLVSFPGAGHFMFVEQPERFAHELVDFLKR